MVKKDKARIASLVEGVTIMLGRQEDWDGQITFRCAFCFRDVESDQDWDHGDPEYAGDCKYVPVGEIKHDPGCTGLALLQLLSEV